MVTVLIFCVSFGLFKLATAAAKNPGAAVSAGKLFGSLFKK